MDMVLFCIADAIALVILAGLNFYRGGRPALRRMYAIAALAVSVYLIILAATDPSLTPLLTQTAVKFTAIWPLAYTLTLVIPFSLFPKSIRKKAIFIALGVGFTATCAEVIYGLIHPHTPFIWFAQNASTSIAILVLLIGQFGGLSFIIGNIYVQRSTDDTVYRHLSNIILRWSAAESIIGGIATFSSIVWSKTPIDIPTIIIGLTLTGMGIRLAAYHPFDLKSRSVADSLLFSMPDALFIMDVNGYIHKVNPAAELLLDTTQSNLIGKNWHDLARPLEYTHLIKPTEPATSASTGFQAEFIKADGTSIPVFCSSAQLIDLVDRIQGQVIMARDIGEYMDAEIQLEKSRNLRAIAHLVRGISHDFRETLTVIHGSAELLASSLDDDQIANDAQAILNATEKAQSVIEQLVIIDDEQERQKIVVDVTQALKEITQTIDRSLDKSIVVTVSLPEKSLSVYTRPGEIERIIMNLVTNAHEAMPTGGQLDISLEEYSTHLAGSEDGEHNTENYAVITIHDTGRGMSRDVLEHIFDPFFTTRADRGGTGLGLPTVQTLVQRMNGCVDVRSIVNVGTTVEIALPLCPDIASTLVAHDEFNLNNHEKATILILDDTEPVRELAATMLKKLGYETLVAGNWEEGLSILNDTTIQIDILLVDVVMPEVSGPEFVQLAGKRRNGFGVVYMSGYTGREQELIATELDKVQFLTKPFSRDSLAEAILAALGHERGERQ